MARSRSPPPIDKGWAWMIAVGFFLYVFFMVGLAKSYGLLLGQLIKEFHISTAYATTPITLCLVTYAFAAPCAIILGQHITIRKVVIGGAIIGFVGMAISSLMVSMLYFTIIFGVCYGLGNSGFYGNGMIMLGTYFKDRRSFANGIALSGASIGQFALPPIIEYLLENYGLSGTVLLIGAFYLHGAISGCLFRPIEKYAAMETLSPPAVENLENGESKPMLEATENGNLKDEQEATPDTDLDGDIIYKEKMEDDNADNDDFDFDDKKLTATMASSGSIYLVTGSVADLGSEVDASKKSASKPSGQKDSKRMYVLHAILKVLDFRVLKNYITLFYTIVSFLCFFGYFNFVLFLPSIVLEKGITRYDKAMIISICGVGDLIARLAVGFFADLNLIARYRIKAIACLLCAIDIFMFLFADSFAWLGVHSFLYGFLGGSYVCMVAVVLVDFVGLAKMGQNLAVILFIQGIGSSAGQPLLGYLRDSTESFDIIIVICAFTLGLGALILFFYPWVQKLEAKRQEKLQENSKS